MGGGGTHGPRSERALVHRRVPGPLLDRSPEEKPNQEQDEKLGVDGETTDFVLKRAGGGGIWGTTMGPLEELQRERESNLERGA